MTWTPFTADLLPRRGVVLTDKQLMIVAATRIEELLQDVSAACGGKDAWDFGSVNLINDLRERAQ